MSAWSARFRPRPLLAVATVLALTATLLMTAHGSATADVGASRRDVAQFTRLVNRARTTRGRAPLARHRELDRLATAHARRMGRGIKRNNRCDDAGRLRHRNPVSRGVDARWTALAENVGYYCHTTASHRRKVRRLHRMLMRSRGHRANLLNRQMRHVGIGTYRDADGGLWVTQIFMDTD